MRMTMSVGGHMSTVHVAPRTAGNGSPGRCTGGKRMFRSIAVAVLVAAAQPALADEVVPPLDPYLDEQIVMVGLPGDEGFYEMHLRPDGTEYYVDAEGAIYRNLEEMMAKAEARRAVPARDGG